MEVSINSGFQVLQLTGKLAEQELRVIRARTTARRALRSGHVRAAARCAQPCAGTLELRVGGRRVSRRPVALGRSGAATRALPLTRAARRLLRRRPAARVSVVFTAVDRLTGEGRRRVRTLRRSLG